MDNDHGYATPLKNYGIEVAAVPTITIGRQRLEARELGARDQGQVGANFQGALTKIQRQQQQEGRGINFLTNIDMIKAVKHVNVVSDGVCYVQLAPLPTPRGDQVLPSQRHNGHKKQKG